ncbi:NAD(P)/FAD-dependent oxidoreductase [Spirochaetota bacterium]
MKAEKNHCDVLIIGAGVSGANIARRLSAYDLDIILADKEVDVSFGTSKANSGIIHGGFHHNKKYLKSRLEIQGMMMFDRLRQELDFPFKRCGIVVAALHEDEMRAIDQLYMQGVDNGVIGLEMCSRERLLELEPKLHPDVLGGLWVPGGGIVEPYRFVFTLVESAKKNGVQILTDFKVEHAARVGDEWTVRAEDGRSIKARYAVNAAGLFADEVSSIFGAEDYKIRARKGEYYLLDRMTKACPDRVIFPVPTSISKGVLIVPTTEGTVLLGPTAEVVEDKENMATNRDKLEKILSSTRTLVPSISESDVITSFAGSRPTMDDEDFYIAPSSKVPAFIQVAGIESPGLTASPAIGEYVKDLLKKEGLKLYEKPDYDPFIGKRPRVMDMSPYDVDKLSQAAPGYGNMVCRCEKVSEAEIVEAIHAGHSTLDGIKYFTRAQMGRCQGGFCTYKIIKIIMRETGLSWDEITKNGHQSHILKGVL